jgi:hypothetical protein
MNRCILLLLLSSPMAQAAEKAPWAFAPPRWPSVPVIRNRHSEIRNPIDAFILARLQAKGLTPSQEANRATLLRRVSFDLTGLPPSVAEQEAFFRDQSADAYEKVVDRLLASPAYGERWAQHWLDLVRYAESDGFKADDHRPAAHRYRDWVIRALNADLPYDRFLSQQIAGDELEPDNPDALIATGFLRLYPDEYNAANLEQRWQEILDDITDVTGQVFLGLTVGCARCHDHKYDPITQKDYFALESFFAPLLPRDDRVALTERTRRQYEQERAGWEQATQSMREEMEQLCAPYRATARKHALEKFRAEIQQAVLTPSGKRTPYQEQIAALAEKQLRAAEKEVPNKLPAEKKKRFQELEKALAAIPGKPRAPEPVMAVSDIGRTPPPTHRLRGGNWKNPREAIQPGFPEFLGKSDVDTHLPRELESTGRRAALARWLTRPDHPLTARVIVNRLWQHHFGVGLVATPGDFGAQGDAPSHPELLDWLACELVGPAVPDSSSRPGQPDLRWSIKHIHRLIVTSLAYQQASRVDPSNEMHRKALAVDRDNKLLWHARRKRLEGEALRDALLALSGELNRRAFGPSARPKLPEGISKYAWKPDVLEADQHRRSIYVLAKRNMRYPLFDVFDLPDMHNSCSRRAQTTTAPQALLLLNSELTLERARHWGAGLQQRFSDDLQALVTHAFRAAWGRVPAAQEVALGVAFIQKQEQRLRSERGPVAGAPGRSPAITDFCHAIINSNEMLYVD